MKQEPADAARVAAVGIPVVYGREGVKDAAPTVGTMRAGEVFGVERGYEIEIARSGQLATASRTLSSCSAGTSDTSVTA